MEDSVFSIIIQWMIWYWKNNKKLWNCAIQCEVNFMSVKIKIKIKNKIKMAEAKLIRDIYRYIYRDNW